MTHDELLARILEQFQDCGCDEDRNCFQSDNNDWDAIYWKAVLHKPIETYNMNNVHKSWLTCNHCNDEIYPCLTIQAIQEQLK